MKLRSRKTAIAAAVGILFFAGATAIGVAGVIPTDKDIENVSTVDNEESVIEETVAIEPVDRDIVMGNVKEFLESTQSEEESTQESEQGKAVEPETEQPKSEYDDKFMVNVEESLNIRAEANEEAEIIGKLYAGAGGTVLENGDDWTKISSGNVEGYVSTQYLLFGEAAKSKAEEVGTYKATITEDNIRVRKQPGTDTAVLGLADLNDVYTAGSIADGWVEINYDGEQGYVLSEYTSVELIIGKAVSIEEEQEQIRLEEERKRQAELEEQARVEEELTASNENSYVQTIYTDAYDVAQDDSYLLACLVHAEAGSEPYEGKLAVANVVLNRVNSGKYGGTIESVIYARGQFSVVSNGRLAKVMAQGPNSESIQAANEALAGVNNVPDYSFFCTTGVANYSRYNNYSIIGTQVFYN